MNRINRAKGMLVGLAVGDSLGANLEFSGLKSHQITDDLIPLPYGMWNKGEWTDDTSMALCLADSLLDDLLGMSEFKLGCLLWILRRRVIWTITGGPIKQAMEF